MKLISNLSFEQECCEGLSITESHFFFELFFQWSTKVFYSPSNLLTLVCEWCFVEVLDYPRFGCESHVFFTKFNGMKSIWIRVWEKCIRCRGTSPRIPFPPLCSGVMNSKCQLGFSAASRALYKNRASRLTQKLSNNQMWGQLRGLDFNVGQIKPYIKGF